MSGRRRGKPNRGGSRFNKPRGGGRGGGGSKKGASSGWDDGEDFSLDFCSGRSNKNNHGGMWSANTGRGRGGVGKGGRGRSRGTGMGVPKSLLSERPRMRRTDESGRPGPDLSQMPLQRIHMTSENQALVKELLRELQTQDFEDPDEESGSEPEEEAEEEYDELDYREDGQYWETHDELMERAESPSDPSLEAETEEGSRVSEPTVSLFAVGKLCRYGFDRERGKRALEAGTGEVGATLEQLLLQVFSERYGPSASIPEGLQSIPMDECVAQRQEEALALAAIFGERFTERIVNSVWTVSLDPHLFSKPLEGVQDSTAQKLASVNLKDVCRFYLKGAGCRFGEKCKFKHQVPSDLKQPADPAGPSRPGFSSCSPPEYELEVRFPKDNRYPFQAALVAFSTNDEKISSAGRLQVTEYLYGEALASAQSGEPAVYTLITCFEDEARIMELLAASHHKYSSPLPVVMPPSAPLRPKAARGTTSKMEAGSTNSICSKHLEETEILDQRFRDGGLGQLPEEQEEQEQEDEVQEVPMEKESYVKLRKKLTEKYAARKEALQQDNAKLCRQFRTKQSSRRYLSMLQERQNLPAWQEKERVLCRLKKCQVLVVSGMTGCGKTTQIPQFILDDSLKGPLHRVANIICTQPRRISAISVAERVAQERAERLGNSVGYQIRLETVRSSLTRLLYCTTGVLLRRLEGEPELGGVTHVIVDEVHERTEESDFLLLVLKDVMAQRPDLKVILMSATLNADLFSQYFCGSETVHIPGRTFPVDQFFLEDAIAMTRYVMEDGSPYARSGKPGPQSGRKTSSGNPVDQLGDDMWSFMSFQKKDFVKDSVPDQQLNLQELAVRYKDTQKSVLKTLASMDLDKINMDLVECLLEWIVDGQHNYPPGAILVFMPGLSEIKMLYEQLQSNRLFNNRKDKRCVVYPLHSSLTNEEQQAVFSRPPKGVTKIIISTNIAETSVTIDDVVYVVDSGKMKEKRYDASKSMESLEDLWVSRANALQRKGRAGRVASGVCFHLFTSHCLKHQLAEQQIPEIQRIPLERLCLRIKVLDVFAERPLEDVFSRLIEPPLPGGLDAAKQRLQDLGALTPEEKLTPLGYHLACLPVDVRIGKLMLFGAIFRCLDPALTIAASLAFKSPFVSPWDKREEAKQMKQSFAVANSDHLALLQAYKGWCAAAKKGNQAGFHFCRENFLSARVLQEIASLKRQFAELLSDIGFVKEELKARDIERLTSRGTDGILEGTGFEANLNSDNIKLISAILCAALYPNVVQVRAPQGKYKLTSKGAMKMQPKAEELRFVTKTDGCVHIHPSSINYAVRHYDSPYLVYHEKVKTSRVFIRDCSMVSVYALVLFGGGQVSIELLRGEFVVSLDDGWIRFAAASHQVAELVKELRWELDQLLEDKIRNPSMDLCSCPRGSRIISMIVNLISTQ
ncbi:putative ATP-dependent RNA helicase DHX57 [Brienomyrus brachyistius]|uniref:putative ATP-dependent RNA helicase DHX57 n=1 Tax=Brienomyrus brachyistius TaxID=42636 RepID=UPI0020B25559|nr:putative ATP-dependent RNA helicase DHX57 [Brienomyrus brachyistius]XP_048862851.1 putative ATP-dependent RNA helicase DHX57 [Brienomyrus brachyistius]XP_048862852.1 putative ATP-dependent RNA helicase DHX57 [Brienomyrus brachyistius]